MRPDRIVMAPPAFDDDLSFLEGVEDLAIGASAQVLHHPHVMGRLLRDLNTAGVYQRVRETAYENNGEIFLGRPAHPPAPQPRALPRRTRPAPGPPARPPR